MYGDEGAGQPIMRQTLGGGVAGAAAQECARKPTALDRVREDAERLTARIGGVKHRLEQIATRLAGPVPTDGSDQARDVANVSGFIPGTANAVDRAHVEVTAIEQLLSGFEEIV